MHDATYPSHTCQLSEDRGHPPRSEFPFTMKGRVIESIWRVKHATSPSHLALMNIPIKIGGSQSRAAERRKKKKTMAKTEWMDKLYQEM